MFGIGLTELLLIAAVALIVLGPEKLPIAARTAGLWYGKLRRTIANMQSEIEAELNLAEAKKQMQEELEKIKAAERAMQENMHKMEQDIQAMQNKAQQDISAQEQAIKAQVNGKQQPTHASNLTALNFTELNFTLLTDDAKHSLLPPAPFRAKIATTMSPANNNTQATDNNGQATDNSAQATNMFSEAE